MSVTPAPTPPSQQRRTLAFTGTSNRALVVAGVAFVTVGIALLVWRHRWPAST